MFKPFLTIFQIIDLLMMLFLVELVLIQDVFTA